MILITSATGMTGHFVVQALQQRNLPVRVLVWVTSIYKTPPSTELWHFRADRLRSTLGFTPKFTLRQTLQAVVAQT